MENLDWPVENLGELVERVWKGCGMSGEIGSKNKNCWGRGKCPDFDQGQVKFVINFATILLNKNRSTRFLAALFEIDA